MGYNLRVPFIVDLFDAQLCVFRLSSFPLFLFARLTGYGQFPLSEPLGELVDNPRFGI